MSTELLKGVVTGVKHQKDNGWGICTVLVGKDEINVVGILPLDIQADDVLEAVGYTKTHPTYGKQFNLQTVTKYLSSDQEAIETWLMDNLPHIGEVRAQALVKKFGSDLWFMLETNPSKLLVVNGITEERVKEIVTAYNSVSKTREVTVWLLNLGLAAKDAASAVRLFGAEHVQAEITENPYCLDSIRGFNFEAIDTLALKKLKYPKVGIHRIHAFIRVVLHDQLLNGHCYMVRHTLLGEVATQLAIPLETVDAALTKGVRGICMRDKKVMLEDIDADEAEVASVVCELLARGQDYAT